MLFNFQLSHFQRYNLIIENAQIMEKKVTEWNFVHKYSTIGAIKCVYMQSPWGEETILAYGAGVVFGITGADIFASKR